jgi:membrane protease YdiL (CAAX protease family)
MRTSTHTQFEQRVQWRHAVGFVALAYGITWLTWASVMPDAFHALLNGTTPSTYTFAGGGAGMFGPAIAALIMRRFVSRDPIRGTVGARRNWRYYAIAIAGPMLLVTATIVISMTAGIAEFDPGKPVWLVYVALVAATPIAAVMTLGEEYGWRGYLLPKLLPLGEVKASIIVGLVWGPWHAPLLFAGLNYGGVNPFAALAFMTAVTVLLSLLFTRLFVVAGGSVMVVAFAHASLNGFSDRLADAAHLAGNPLVAGITGLVGLGVLAVTVLWVYGHRRSAQQRVAVRVVTAA